MELSAKCPKRISKRATKWQRRFTAKKYKAMYIETPPPPFTYTLMGSDLAVRFGGCDG